MTLSDLSFPHAQPPAPGAVTQVAPGILWFRLPLPYRLDHVNIYLIEDEDGWRVLDTGLGTDACRQGWEALLAGPLQGQRLTGMVVTHYHPDHVGLAGWLADRFGLDVICVRIGLWFPTPPQNRGLATWLSPDDGARLVEACLSAPSPGFRLVWGVSRNTRRWWSLAEGEAIGYYPKDDAEVFAAERIAELGEPDFANDPELNRVGGWWCDWPLAQRMG